MQRHHCKLALRVGKFIGMLILVRVWILGHRLHCSQRKWSCSPKVVKFMIVSRWKLNLIVRRRCTGQRRDLSWRCIRHTQRRLRFYLLLRWSIRWRCSTKMHKATPRLVRRCANSTGPRHFRSSQMKVTVISRIVSRWELNVLVRRRCTRQRRDLSWKSMRKLLIALNIC